MNKEIKSLWLEALRSGEYEQTERVLRSRVDYNKYAYCCLGVLCDVLSEKGFVEGSWGKGVDDNTFITLNLSCSTDDLSNEILSWLGMSVEQHDHLATSNDDGESFIKIADWIEENL